MVSLLQASTPRSGNHLLLGLLWNAIPDGLISVCEYYTAPNCCKQLPCTKHIHSTPLREPDTVVPSRLFVHKSHDFKISDIPPCNYDVIFQFRDPYNYLISHLIWEMEQLHDFNESTAIAFLHNSALYYIRMHLKWSVLYAEKLLVPPIAFESLMPDDGKLQALRSIMAAVSMGLNDEQETYAINQASLHSHTGLKYQGSATKNRNAFFKQTSILAVARSWANEAILHLPMLNSLYQPAVISGSHTACGLFSFWPAALVNDAPLTSNYIIDLSRGNCIRGGEECTRPTFIEGLGLESSHQGSTWLLGNIILLPVTLPSVAKICSISIEIALDTQDACRSEYFKDKHRLPICAIYHGRVVANFYFNAEERSLQAETELTVPIEAYSRNILIAIGIRPDSLEVASVCDEAISFLRVCAVKIGIVQA